MANNSPSIEKNLEMLSKIAKKDFIVEYNGKAIQFKAPKSVLVSQTFFRRFDCQMCGWCCIRATLDYYPNQLHVTDGREIEKDMVRVDFRINGNAKFLCSYDQLDHTGKKCKYLRPTTCTIHDHHSFNCRLEPIKIRKRGDRGYLMKTFPGRKWVKRDGISAQCKFFEFDEDQLKNHDIPLLKEMLSIAEYLGIETWLPEVIAELNLLLNTGNLPAVEKLSEKNKPIQAILIGKNY